MAKGDMAKKKIINKMAEVFDSDWIGEVDKKYYVWQNDNGERIQIAIALTCPKKMVEVAETVAPRGDFDWSGNAEPQPAAVVNAPSAEITEEEKNNVAELLAKLGL